MPEPIIRVEKLSKSFGELEVLKDINMEVREGEVISVIGALPVLEKVLSCAASTFWKHPILGKFIIWAMW